MDAHPRCSRWFAVYHVIPRLTEPTWYYTEVLHREDPYDGPRYFNQVMWNPLIPGCHCEESRWQILWFRKNLHYLHLTALHCHRWRRCNDRRFRGEKMQQGKVVMESWSVWERKPQDPWVPEFCLRGVVSEKKLPISCNCVENKQEKNGGFRKFGAHPKSSMFLGFSIINHPFGGTPMTM